MKLSDLRPSFTVYLVGSNMAALDAVGKVVTEAGYLCLRFEDLTGAFSEVYNTPPHFIILDVNERRFDLNKAFVEVSSQLPETHLYLVAPLEQRPQIAEFYKLGLYDVLWTPPVSAREWVKALDRASERDYFMYMNEQLKNTDDKENTAVGWMDFQKRIMARGTPNECLHDFLEFGSHLFGGCGALFLKYHTLRKVLTAAQALKLPNDQWKGVGVDFNTVPDFRWTSLLDPQSVTPLKEMLAEVFEQSTFQAVSLEFARELSGVAVFFADRPTPDAVEKLGQTRDLVQIVCSYLELNKRLHTVSSLDDSTNLMNRSHFVERVRSEVVRARRTEQPISLLTIALDSYGPVVSQSGQEEGQTLLKIFARIFAKHSRLNDILARNGVDEFAILLPDTDREGAVIKAERLRRMIEGGDFSKALKFATHPTISIGISEYPNLCRDADELLQTADEALYQVRERGNRVCVAKAPADLTPDFKVVKKSPAKKAHGG